MDTLQFRFFDPRGKETWADDFPGKEHKATEIYLNGVELVAILKKIELPYATAEGATDLAGDYGHQTPSSLYFSLTSCGDEEVDLLCCRSCGEVGCWTISIDIERDDHFVWWKNFHNCYRDWEYNLLYQFDRTAYEAVLEQLRCEAQ